MSIPLGICYTTHMETIITTIFSHRSEQVETVPPTPPAQGFDWIHVQGDLKQAHEWFCKHMALPMEVVDFLCRENSRPRAIPTPDGLVMNVRAPTWLPELGLDLVSLRLFITDQRWITVSARPLPVLDHIKATLLAGTPFAVGGPAHTAAALCATINEHCTSHFEDIEEHLSACEDEWERSKRSAANNITNIQWQLSQFKRFNHAQLDAYRTAADALQSLNHSEKLKQGWREVENSWRRNIEMLDEIRERLMILRDAERLHSNYKSNHLLSVISVVSMFFLPLTFLTGLLGINVGGIPLAEHAMGFWLVCICLILTALIQVIGYIAWNKLRDRRDGLIK